MLVEGTGAVTLAAASDVLVATSLETEAAQGFGIRNRCIINSQTQDESVVTRFV